MINLRLPTMTKAAVHWRKKMASDEMIVSDEMTIDERVRLIQVLLNLWRELKDKAETENAAKVLTEIMAQVYALKAGRVLREPPYSRYNIYGLPIRQEGQDRLR